MGLKVLSECASLIPKPSSPLLTLSFSFIPMLSSPLLTLFFFFPSFLCFLLLCLLLLSLPSSSFFLEPILGSFSSHASQVSRILRPFFLSRL